MPPAYIIPDLLLKAEISAPALCGNHLLLSSASKIKYGSVVFSQGLDDGLLFKRI
jgi:hypothetical protein